MFKKLRYIRQAAFVALTGAALSVFAEEAQVKSPIESTSANSWIIGFDNDILVPGGRDQDYTYGVRLARVGDESKNHLFSIHSPLAKIDNIFRLDRAFSAGFDNTSIEYGIFGFTPEDTSISEVNPDDRPYASLVYTSSAKQRLNFDRKQAWHSSLTVGFLGLPIVGDLQEGIHNVIGNDTPEGWDNQISSGGEPTFRYSLAKQNLIPTLFERIELKQTRQASVGYLTEASWSLGLRAGKIRSPWVGFNPEQSFYGEQTTNKNTSAVQEHFFWAGIAMRARIYNAFLQGQFRDSDLTYNYSELNHLITEAWMGYTVSLKNGYSFSYYVRGHTTEVKEGSGNRNLIWGGLSLSRFMG